MQTVITTLPGNRKLTINMGKVIINGMEYLSTDEASELTGYSVQYLRRLIRKKNIVAIKKGGRFWVEVESLMAYKKQMDSLGSEKYSPWRQDD